MAAAVSVVEKFILTISLLLMFTVAGSAATINLVRGIELKRQPFYLPDKDFTCMDGTKKIPFSSVNDDYCDCNDGTDEPGTAACPEGKYYCYNLEHKAKYIQSSRVNDGICDCCDGSDEYDSSVVCFNECAKHGKEAEEKEKEALAESMIGINIRKQYIEAGHVKKAEKKTRIEDINTLLEERRKQLESVKANKEAAEAPEKEAKEKHDKIWDDLQVIKKEQRDRIERKELFALLDIDKDGWISIQELLSHNNLDKDMDLIEAQKVLGGETMVDAGGLVAVWKSLKPRFLKNGRIDPTKFDEGTEDVASPLVPPTSPTSVTDDTGEKTDKKEEGEKSPEEEKPEYDQETKQLIEVADKARSDFDAVNKIVKELETEKNDIEAYLNFDYGTEEEFSSLKGQCFEITDREYTYKLCPFDKVTQKPKDGGSETDLGNKMTWTGGEGKSRYNIMKYGGGTSCWNGPARSMLVRLSCGKENVVLGVSEPSRCEYEMTFKTPALCQLGDETHDEL